MFPIESSALADFRWQRIGFVDALKRCRSFPRQRYLEAPSGFGPENKGFADLRLTTWLWRLKKWSGRRGSDSRPPPWQGGALPTELLPHVHWTVETGKTVRTKRLELLRLGHQNLNLARLPIPPRPQAARQRQRNDPLEIRTPDTLIKSQVLCQLS